ncbi:hypothetical protein C4577_04920 [Candidatus Parcubacteria bacterium]|nr:MAG: hypothetical protein C4577_04920 [Candidatus Parcubacteria bacterium]
MKKDLPSRLEGETSEQWIQKCREIAGLGHILFEQPIVLCELCNPDVQEICELIPGYALVYDRGIYYLAGEDQGHGDAVTFFFPGKPTPDPDPLGILEDENDPTYIASTEWIDRFDEYWDDIKLSPESGWCLVNAAEEYGFGSDNIHSLLCFWLAHKAGVMIEDFEKKHGPFKPKEYFNDQN